MRSALSSVEGCDGKERRGCMAVLIAPKINTNSFLKGISQLSETPTS